MADNNRIDTIMSGLRELDTAAVSDALDSLGISGGLAGITSQVPGTKACGPAHTVRYRSVSENPGFRNAANYIDDVPLGSVIVSSNLGRTDCTVWGDILTQVSLLRGLSGTVIDGAARDIGIIRDLSYPLYSRAVYMQTGKSRVELEAVQVPVEISGVNVNPGDYVLCDDNGCVCIPKHVAAEVIERARSVEFTEQLIIKSIRDGQSLRDARSIHRYDQPWLAAKQ